MKYFVRYFIYAIIGFLIPWAIDSIIGNNNTWEYFACTIVTFMAIVAHMSKRDYKYFKHEEWKNE
jgi:bacteriorhodopsin